MVLLPDQGAVQELAPTSADPAFGDGIHARRLDVAEHGPDPASARTASNAAVKPEPRSRIIIDPVRVLAEIHDQVAGLLGGPFPGGMRSDSEVWALT
jgi:hypothetical protein